VFFSLALYIWFLTLDKWDHAIFIFLSVPGFFHLSCTQVYLHFGKLARSPFSRVNNNRLYTNTTDIFIHSSIDRHLFSYPGYCEQLLYSEHRGVDIFIRWWFQRLCALVIHWVKPLQEMAASFSSSVGWDFFCQRSGWHF
jgi:hypothetical protein